MRIFFTQPSHRLSIDGRQILRRLDFRNWKETYSNKPSRRNLIIIANGSPDHIAIIILLHLLNHRELVDMAFPKHKHLAIIDYIPKYMEEDYENIILIIDQETLKIKEIHNYIENKLNPNQYEETKDLNSRLAKAIITHGNRKAALYITINGIEDKRFTKHTIEDHLLQLAEKIGLIKIKEKINPKETWIKLSKEKQEITLKAIRQSKIKEIFPQQVEAIIKAIRT